MVSSISNASYVREMAAPVVAPAQSQSATGAEPSPGSQIDQAMEALNSTLESDEAMALAELAIFREGLNIAKDIAQQMIGMIAGSNNFEANARMMASPSKTLDVVA